MSLNCLQGCLQSLLQEDPMVGHTELTGVGLHLQEYEEVPVKGQERRVLENQVFLDQAFLRLGQ